MKRYDKIEIGGLEAILKDEKALLRVLEIDGNIGEVKGEGSKSNLKFINTEGFDNLFSVSSINQIVISSGNGEVFRGLCKLVRMDMNGREYGFIGGDFEVRIIGNNAVWFEKLKGVTLRDLDWGVLSYDSGGIVDGFFANPMSDKYGFGLGKWGKWRNDDGNNTFMVDIDESTFIGFIKFILENGFKKVGYTVESEWLNSPFIALGMPFSMKVYDEEWLKNKYDVELIIDSLKITRIDGSTVTIGNADGLTKNSSTSVFTKILLNNKDDNGNDLFRDLGRPSWYQQSPQVPTNAPNRFSYECVETGAYEVYLVNENYSALADLNVLSMEIFINCPTNGNPNQGQQKGVVNLNGKLIINLTEGDVVDFNFWISSPFALTLEFNDIRWGIKWAREVGLSRKWLIGGLMPNWKISDILGGCIHGFNLKFETDEIFKRVVCEPSDEWKNGLNGLKSGFYKEFNGEAYDLDVRNKKKSQRVKNRLILSERGELEKIELNRSIIMMYPMDSLGAGIEDRTKSKILEGKIVFSGNDSDKDDEYDNPFFNTTHQIYETRIKGSNSKFTPIVPFLGDFDYYDKGEEIEPSFSDTPRLICFGGQRAYVNGDVKGGTVRMNGNNNYDLPAMWVVNYNDEIGEDLSLSFGDEYNVKGSKIWGLIKRFYLRNFIRIENGNKYKMVLEYGVGNISFRDVWDYDGKAFILKKIEGFDGRDRQVCKTYFDEDVFLREEDFDKVKDVVLKNIGNVL